MNPELEKLPTETLLRASFAAQREASGAATNQEELDLLTRLIERELLAVSGVFERERRFWNMKEMWASKEFRVSQARQEATIVAKRVAIRFAAAQSAARYGRKEEIDPAEVLVLRVDEVFANGEKWHGADPTPSYRQLLTELVSHPGWSQDGLFSRLIDIGALVKPRFFDQRPAAEFGGRWGTYDTAPDLELVVLRLDGSGFLEFAGGERRAFAAVKHPFRPVPFLDQAEAGSDPHDPFFDFDYWLELDDWCAEKYRRSRPSRSRSTSELWLQRGMVQTSSDGGDADREVARLCPSCDTVCRRCQKGKMIHVVFGYITHQMLEDEAAGRYEVGGCLMPESPEHRCNACGEREGGDERLASIWRAVRSGGAGDPPLRAKRRLKRSKADLPAGDQPAEADERPRDGEDLTGA